MTLSTGTTLENRYRIEGLLGQGGMGAVYRAYDTRLQQAVAIKENTMAVPGISPEAVAASRHQFECEALMLARLRHPNLPRVSDHFVTPDGNQYLVMDYIEGDDLAHILARGGPLPEAQAVAWISQACSALEYLHTQQPPIIHRDIKPQNIKVTSQGRIYLVDFGIAKIGGERSKTATGALGVTPGFSPPEQYAMIGTDARSDVYALGATLYALLTGHTPPESISLMSGEAHLMPPQHVNSKVSLAVQQAVLKAMAPRKTDRSQSVAEFRQMLSAKNVEYEAKRAERVTPPSVRLVQIERPASVPVKVTVSVPPKSAPTSNRVWGWIVAAAISVMVIVLSFALWKVYQGQVAQAQAAATASVPLTVTAQAQATDLAQAQATATVQAQATVTAQARAEATRQAQSVATAQAVEGIVATLVKQAKQVYGPTNGDLVHKEDNNVKGQFASVNLRNFIAEVQFLNPYDAAQHAWDCGIIFRATNFYIQYRVLIDSKGKWFFRAADVSSDNRPQSKEFASGKVSNVNTAADGSNHLRLIVNDKTAFFFVNGEYVATLDVSGRNVPGDVLVGIGYDDDREINGRSTRYKNFSVWSLP
jgi:hypothetical protein